MNEWLKNLMAKVKESWAKWSGLQKGIVIGIVAVVIVVIIVMVNVSSSPTTVRLFNSPVTGDSQSQILTRLDQENVKANVDATGYISVADEDTAKRMRDILISEGLVPSSIDPFASYYNRTWSTTNADQNVKLAQAITRTVKQHIEALDDVAVADVNLVLPEDKLFTADQHDVSASVILKVKPMSDMLTNRRKILGVQRLLISAVEGLTAENTVISDSEGNILNDFEGMADSDRISLVEKQQKLIQKQEVYYRAVILKALQKNFTEKRVTDVLIKISMDMSKKSVNSTKYSPIEKKADNPDTPYDDSEYLDTLPVSFQTVTREWQGTGFNPEGPAGVEGQNPPVYSDMSNVIGHQTETGVTQNNVINTDIINEEKSPTIDKITVAVNIDGTWKIKRDKNHNPLRNEEGGILREYVPMTKEEMEQIAEYLQSAIGYDRAAGYRVTVINQQVDRTAEHAAEDEALIKAERRTMTIIIVLVVIAVMLVLFILYRFVSRELERRRRIKEEELRRKQQAAREQAMLDAREEGMEVTMSVEERKRAELQENAIAMAKEHPEDVAMLIRTWLMEE